MDLAVTNSGENTVSILIGNGDGTFARAESIVSSDRAGTLAIADFDGDGKNDIAVTLGNSNLVSIYRGRGDGTFDPSPADFPAGTTPFFIAAADMDKDGKPDLAVTNYGSNRVTILLNRSGECVQAPSGILAWWGGDNNPLDIVGTNNGTLMNGATYGAGKVGQAFSFDGVDDYVNIPAFNMGTDWTIAGWLNPAGASDGTHHSFFSRSNGNQDGMTINYLGPGHSNANQIGVVIGNGSTWQLASYSGTQYPLNFWYHIAVSKSGDTYTLYVNGQMKDRRTATGVSTDYQARAINLGHWNYGVSLEGLIDEVEIFNRALSAEEVTATYNAGSWGKCKPCFAPPSNMVSWWGGDNNALDMVGTNNGTLQGGATYASGKVGQAFSFDGAEASFVEIPNTAAFNPSGAFSVDGWFYIDPEASGNIGEIATLIAKTEGSTGNGWAIYFDDRSGVGASKSLKFALGTVLELQNAIPTANWYHIAGVFDPQHHPIQNST